MRLPQLTLFSVIWFSRLCAANSSKRIYDLPVSTEALDDLKQQWHQQATSGLMAAVANRFMAETPPSTQASMEHCFKTANDVPSHARCLAPALIQSRGDVLPINEEQKHVSEELRWVGGFGQARAKRNIQRLVAPTAKARKPVKNMQHQPDLALRRSYGERESPVRFLARMLTRVANSMHDNKNSSMGWRQAVEVLKSRASDGSSEASWDQGLTAVDRGLSQFRQRFSGAIPRSANVSATSSSNRNVSIPVALIQQTIATIRAMANSNDPAAADESTVRILSPKFLSLSPNSDLDRAVLSPDLYSMHEGDDNSVAPLPKLFGSFSADEREAWMDFIMASSGATKTLQDLLAKQSQSDSPQTAADVVSGTAAASRGVVEAVHVDTPSNPYIFSKDDLQNLDLGDTADFVIAKWQQLYESYSADQLQELNTTGYSFLSRDQLEVVYGPNGALNGSQPDFDLDEYGRLSPGEREQALHYYLRRLSVTEPYEYRLRAVTLTPLVLNPLISASATLSMAVTLSPLVLSPIILSPAVLGPITLSPWVFIPLVLSPRALGPMTLSPMVGSPVVLSPLVLHPLILSPGVMNPFVLSPFALSPLILSPQVMTPLILSPFALSPLILSPGVMNPLILSPFVLSPLILSPQKLFALILSPIAASPLIESALPGATVILSPIANG